MSSGTHSILLVVDDESSVCRAVSRLLKGKAGEILSACTPGEAEAILQTKAVTHLLCDHRLGPAYPKGLELALKWRAEFPGIERVVILTGVDIEDFDAPAGIDHILPKITDPIELAEVLNLSSASAKAPADK